MMIDVHAVTDDQIIAEYAAYQRTRWRPRTLVVRTYQLQAISEALPSPLISVTEEDLLRWHDTLRGSPETIASYVSCAKGIFRWMSLRARPRHRLDDPSQILDRPRIPQASPRPMANHHFDLALACAVADPEMYLWLGLMGCSGLRCCEIAWLQVHDIEVREDDSGILHLTGKGGKRRVVPIGMHILATLRPFLLGRGPVFTRPSDGRAYSPDRVSQRVNRFLRSLQIHETAHQLRHRFGTDYHALDPDLYRQAKIMGHASVDTTQRYTEISPVEAARYIEQMTTKRFHRFDHARGRVA